MPRLSSRRSALCAALVCLVILLLLPSPVARAGMNAGSKAEPLPEMAKQPGPVYEIEAGLAGDVFPVFANHASFQNAADRDWGTVTVVVRNSTSKLLFNRISVKIPGWSDEEIQMADVAAGQVERLVFAPTFLPRLYSNRQVVAATARVTVQDASGAVIYTGTTPLRIRSAEDMYWGEDLKYAPFIASWVTPHDSRVEALLSRAKEFMPGRRMPGYEGGKAADAQARATRSQVQAIYRALQEAGVSYVKSSGTLGAAANVGWAERVRLPEESLQRASANCIDGAVLYASLFENLGLESVVVLVPGHAYVGVKLAESGNDYLYLETALTGRANFEAAVRSAERGLRRVGSREVVRVRIRESRQAGIFPLPNGRETQELGQPVAAK